MLPNKHSLFSKPRLWAIIQSAGKRRNQIEETTVAYWVTVVGGSWLSNLVILCCCSIAWGCLGMLELLQAFFWEDQSSKQQKTLCHFVFDQAGRYNSDEEPRLYRFHLTSCLAFLEKEGGHKNHNHKVKKNSSERDKGEDKGEKNANGGQIYWEDKCPLIVPLMTRWQHRKGPEQLVETN